ncbi:MAG: DUF1127 domain-containing protein [Burkholderiales bacterium]
MITTTAPLPAPAAALHPPAAHPFVRALVTALLAADAWLVARRQRRADRHALAGMSEHALRDLGLQRAPDPHARPLAEPWLRS